MILSYDERSPSVDSDAWVAQDATVCGDVTIGAGSRIMHGARLVAEAGGSILGDPRHQSPCLFHWGPLHRRS